MRCWLLFYVETVRMGALQVAKDGIRLPADGKMCPLCTRPRTNPAVVATSGFVFCYTCAFHYVTQVINQFLYSSLYFVTILFTLFRMKHINWFQCAIFDKSMCKQRYMYTEILDYTCCSYNKHLHRNQKFIIVH